MLYEIECWKVQSQPESKFSVTKTRMLQWISGQWSHKTKLDNK